MSLEMLSEVEIVSRTVMGEAEGQGKPGWAGVTHVVRNRVCWPGLRWWGGTFRDVCLARGQFDCWDPAHPRYRVLMELEADNLTLTAIRDVVEKCLRGTIPDPTGGASHYFNPAVVRAPEWARSRKPTAVIGAHHFFAVGLGK